MANEMLKCMIKIGLWRTRGNGQLWYGWEGEEVISHKGKQGRAWSGPRAALYTITGAHLSRIRDVTLGLTLRAVPKQSTEPNQWGVQESTMIEYASNPQLGRT